MTLTPTLRRLSPVTLPAAGMLWAAFKLGGNGRGAACGQPELRRGAAALLSGGRPGREWPVVKQPQSPLLG